MGSYWAAVFVFIGSSMTIWGVTLQMIYHIRREPDLRKRLAAAGLLYQLKILTVARVGKYDLGRTDRPGAMDRYMQDVQAWSWVFLGAWTLYIAAIFAVVRSLTALVGGE